MCPSSHEDKLEDLTAELKSEIDWKNDTRLHIGRARGGLYCFCFTPLLISVAWEHFLEWVQLGPVISHSDTIKREIHLQKERENESDIMGKEGESEREGERECERGRKRERTRRLKTRKPEQAGSVCLSSCECCCGTPKPGHSKCASRLSWHIEHSQTNQHVPQQGRVPDAPAPPHSPSPIPGLEAAMLGMRQPGLASSGWGTASEALEIWCSLLNLAFMRTPSLVFHSVREGAQKQDFYYRTNSRIRKISFGN